MLVHCSDERCEAQFASELTSCPACGSVAGRPVVYSAIQYGKSSNQKLVRRLKLLTAASVLYIAYSVWGSAISKDTVFQIEVGMTPHQVQEIAGEPHYRNATTFCYSVWGMSDMLIVRFDEDDRVDWISF